MNSICIRISDIAVTRFSKSDFGAAITTKVIQLIVISIEGRDLLTRRGSLPSVEMTHWYVVEMTLWDLVEMTEFVAVTMMLGFLIWIAAEAAPTCDKY
jgi:hypothetical protein